MPRRLLFAALVTLPPAVEAGSLHGVGFGSAVELAAQASTTGPLGVFHDLRWIAVYHDSWLLFVVELLVAFAARTALGTGLVALAWPRGVPRPGARELV